MPEGSIGTFIPTNINKLYKFAKQMDCGTLYCLNGSQGVIIIHFAINAENSVYVKSFKGIGKTIIYKNKEGELFIRFLERTSPVYVFYLNSGKRDFKEFEYNDSEYIELEAGG